MSRVTRSQSLEFGATEPHPEGFAERNSFLSALLGRVFRTHPEPQGGEDLSLPRALGEVPRPAAKPQAPVVEGEAPSVEEAAGALPSPADEIERLILHVAASDRPARVRRVLLTYVAPPEAELASLDAAAFASQFARALSLEGRVILVLLGTGAGQRAGLSELVAGTASFAEAIHRETGSRLHILPPGQARVIPGQGLTMVMEALAETYDFVVLAVLDEERPAARALALALAPRADQAVIAFDPAASAPDVSALRDALREAGAGDVLAARLNSAQAQIMAA